MILPNNKNKKSPEEQDVWVEGLTRPVALLVVFISVFIFFFKILFF
jgi:hypothetical protein